MGSTTAAFRLWRPRQALIVVANVSRGVIAAAASHYAVRVIEVTAPAEILARPVSRPEAGKMQATWPVVWRRTAAIPSDVAVTTCFK